MPRAAKRKPSSPADLDPVESAASPINDDPSLRGDAFYRRPGVSDNDQIHAALVASGASPEEAAAAMARQQLAGIPMTDEQVLAKEQAAYDAETARQEAAYAAERASYDPAGRLRLGAPLPGENGRFKFRARPDGTEEVVDSGAASPGVDADFARWADENPGTDRQRRYNPAGFAQEMARRDEQFQERAAAEQAKYGSAVGENWRDAITDEQWQARADREEVARRQAANNRSYRDKVAQGAQVRRAREELLMSPQQKQARENTRLTQQNPFLTLGDPSLNEWQQFVLARNMLNTPQNVTDPNAVTATHNEQALRLLERLGFGNLTPEQTPEGKAVADAKAREANPRAAGVRDISEKNYESKEAQIEIDALAKQHDTSYGGFSYDNERALAKTLMEPPYNMPQAVAEEHAYRAGEKLRWFWNQGGGKAGTRTGASPPAQRPPFEGGDMPRPGVGPFDRPGAAPRPFG